MCVQTCQIHRCIFSIYLVITKFSAVVIIASKPCLISLTESDIKGQCKLTDNTIVQQLTMEF